MDADQIRRLKPELTGYLNRFDDCFARKDTRARMSIYVEGQLSDLGEKSCEPIALAAGIAPRSDARRHSIEHTFVSCRAGPSEYRHLPPAFRKIKLFDIELPDSHGRGKQS